MHGTTMIFLFVVPVMAGFGNYLVPLQIGARDMAFPRLNAPRSGCCCSAAWCMYSSFLFGGGARTPAGRLPAAVGAVSPGHGIDFWIVGLHVLGPSSLLGAINFICTIHNMRAPGMRLTRMPLFTWTIDFYSIMILVARPVLAGALTMLLLDRNFGTNFYDPATTATSILYQHLFWFYSAPRGLRDGAARLRHDLRDPPGLLAQAAVRLQGAGALGRRDHLPRLPGLGPPHVRRPILGAGGRSGSCSRRCAIGVPTGVKVFNWIGTMWMGRIRYEPPMLFAVGFIGLFIDRRPVRHLPGRRPGRPAA